MSRIPEVGGRQELPEGERHIWDEITSSRGQVQGPFKVLLHSPPFAQRAAHLGAYVRFESGDHLPPRVRELAVLSTARMLDCGYEYSAHHQMASKVGISEEEVAAITARQPAGLGEDRWVYDFAEQVIVRHRVADDVFDAAQTRLGLRGVVELTASIGYYCLLAAALNTFGVEPTEPA